MERPGQTKGIYDVAVIGLGPVGATLANLLAIDGLSVIAFDREAEPYALPRAVHFDDEVMRVFQTVGLAEAILPFTHVSPGMHFLDADGRLFLDWSRPREIGANGWNVSYRFHQPDLERILRARVAAHASIDTRLRSDVYSVEARGDGAEIAFEMLDTGRLETVRAKYVVGCDGARSLIRRLIGSEMEDLGFHERWLVVDALLKRPKPELGDYSVQFCDARRPATYVRGVGNRRRWEISLMPGDDARTICDPGNVWKLLSRWLSPDEAELERAVCYAFHSVIAATWRAGRLLIAGDAAHQTPPFLGQGMCAGIRDAANLAWKLGRVVRGEAGEDLLELLSKRAASARSRIYRAGRASRRIDQCERQRRSQSGRTAKAHGIDQAAVGTGTAAGRLRPRGHAGAAAVARERTAARRRGWLPLCGTG